MCDKCGTRLGAYSPQGLCPHCLLADGLDESGGPHPPTAPRRIGDYELLEEIAHGGMGVVWKARQVSLNRTVALKMILAGQLAGEAAVRRLRTEAEAAASLDHPNIVAIHEVGEQEGQQFFSMQLVPGLSLAKHLADSSTQPSPQWTARLLATAARAVHYAHQRGILHRDLKPANILIDAQGQPHITDFGLAKMIASDTDLTLSGMVMGTPHFMSPEQAAGKVRQLTTATDIYSLGAVFYFMLTGRPPFQGETTLGVLRQVAEVEPPRPRTLNRHADRELETICLKCLEKDPQRRYASGDALADGLERRLKNEPILARPSSAFEHVVKWVTRKPALAGALAVCAGLLVIGLAGVTWQWRRAQDEAHRAEATVTRLEIERAEQLFSTDRSAECTRLSGSRATPGAGQSRGRRAHRLRVEPPELLRAASRLAPR
jgi:eukaryotic-like serine/threonine-protein kinase